MKKNLKKDLLIGFEFEFISEYSYYESEKNKIDKLIKKLKQTLKTDNIFFTDNSYDIHKKDSYKLTYEPSIKHDNNLYIPLELITPVFNLDEGLQKLKIILDFLKGENSVTNETTGLHVNLSFKNIDINKKIDPLKLIFFSEDEYKINFWKRKEKRKKEIYFKTLVNPNISVFKKILTNKINNFDTVFDYKKLIKKYPEEILKTLDNFKIMNKPVWLDKKQSINLNKLINDNYIEFRLIGGKNYHLKYNEILKEINYFINLIFKSLDQENDKFCIKKVCKILNNILFKNNNIIENRKIKELIEKYDYIFSNNDIMKYYTMRLILEVEKNNHDEIKKNLEKLLSKRIIVSKDFEKTTKIFYLKLIDELGIKKILNF